MALPDKLSELQWLALCDYARAQAHPKYHASTLPIVGWHVPKKKGPTVVCHAGAVMAFTLGADPAREALPSDYDAATWERLTAINLMRFSLYSEAQVRIGGEPNRALDDIGAIVRSYYNQAIESAPVEIYRIAIDMLQGVGL
jgi:hypothetical protein